MLLYNGHTAITVQPKSHKDGSSAVWKNESNISRIDVKTFSIWRIILSGGPRRCVSCWENQYIHPEMKKFSSFSKNTSSPPIKQRSNKTNQNSAWNYPYVSSKTSPIKARSFLLSSALAFSAIQQIEHLLSQYDQRLYNLS